MNLHKLSDPVSDFWKCPKKGFKKKLFMAFFSSKFYRQIRATIAWRHTCGLGGNQLFLTMKTTSKVVFITREQLISEVAIDDGAQTVLYYCTVLYCGQLSRLHVTSQLFLREGSFKKTTPIFGPVSQQGGGGSERIPTSLTDLAK